MKKKVLFWGTMTMMLVGAGNVYASPVEDKIVELVSEWKESISDLYGEHGKEVYEGKLNVSEIEWSLERGDQLMTVTFDMTADGYVYNYEFRYLWDSDDETWRGTEQWMYSVSDDAWFDCYNDSDWEPVMEERHPWLDF